MKIEDLENLFEESRSYHLCFKGVCDDCGKEIEVTADVEDSGKIVISGGAIYEAFGDENKKALKCTNCYNKDHLLRQRCEVYSRVVGYLRPVQQWNKGKLEEWKQRTEFVVERRGEK